MPGPNGAGKSTSAQVLLAETLSVITFVNADTIAQGLSGFQPDSMAIEAGRIMLKRLKSLAAQRTNFGFETTLSGRSYAGWLASLRRQGYEFELFYFWLASSELAISRVAERVRLGGHAIPEHTIRQRYARSVNNFLRLYRPLATIWRVYDNSGMGVPRLIAQGNEGTEPSIMDREIWAAIERSSQDA